MPEVNKSSMLSTKALQKQDSKSDASLVFSFNEKVKNGILPYKVSSI